jgi:hypothetical protein
LTVVLRPGTVALHPEPIGALEQRRPADVALEALREPEQAMRLRRTSAVVLAAAGVAA